MHIKYGANNMMYPCCYRESSNRRLTSEGSTDEWLSEVDRIRKGRPYNDPELLDVLHLYSFNDGMGVKRCRLVWDPENENLFNRERDPYGEIRVVNLPILLGLAQKEGFIKDHHESS